MAVSESPETSPPWDSTMKLIVGLALIGMLGAFFIRFKDLIGPFLLVFVLSYLLHPLIKGLSSWTRLPWRVSVNIVYIVLIIVLLVSITAIGVVVIQQLQSLIAIVNHSIGDMPQTITNLASREIHLGNYTIKLSTYLNTQNLELITQKLLDWVKPVLGRAGSILSTIASSALTTIGWTFLIVMISYFILIDLDRIPNISKFISIPGYNEDIKRLWHELMKIWNSFLRGQFILFVLESIVYMILMTILGTNYVLAISLVAGIARFIPYVGAWMTWITIGMVTFFQGSNYFGLENWQFMLLAIGLGILADSLFDNMITPRVLGSSVGINPALVLIAAVIAANLIGLIGVMLSAPVLATLKLFGQYIARKMLDLPPFPDEEETDEMMDYPWMVIFQRLREWLTEKYHQWKTSRRVGK